MDKLPSGNYRARVFDHVENVLDEHGRLILDENGDPVQKAVYKSLTAPTKTEVKALVADYKANKKGRESISALTVGKAIEGYLTAKEGVLSPSTLRGYKPYKNYFNDWYSKKLTSITGPMLQEWVSKFSRNHKPKTVENVFSFFKSVATFYKVRLDLSTVTMPQPIKPVYHLPSDKDVETLIKYCRENNPELLKAVYLAAFGTLRRSEICGLMGEDIKGTTIHVYQNRVLGADGKNHVKTTKTMPSDRYIDLPQFVIDLLPKEGRVYAWAPATLTRHYLEALAAIGVEHFRFHDLRHYSASIMHTIGVPDQYIMERGGWGNDKVLKAIYRNTLPDYQREFMEKTNAYFEKFDTQ